MGEYTLNLTSAPTGYPTDLITFNQGGFTFANGRLQSNSIGHNEITSGYIKFKATVGTVKATIGVSSEYNFDFMGLHVSTSTTVPKRKNGNMANISGSETNTFSYSINAPGTYYLHYFYAKDSSQSSESDMGWITSVTLPIESTFEKVNINNTWTPVKGRFVNVNGTWVGNSTHVNVNNTWNHVSTSNTPGIINMMSVERNSTFGSNKIYSTYCEMSSGLSGAGLCVLRSVGCFDIRQDDVISVEILHAVLPNGGSFTTSTVGQGGSVFLSVFDNYEAATSNSTATQYIYQNSRTPGINTKTVYTVTSRSTFLDAYLFVSLDATPSSGDTYMQLFNVTINGRKVYPI